MGIIFFATITVAAFILVMWKIDIHYFTGYQITSDIVGTVLMTFLYAGTYTGMAVAVLGGFMLTIALSVQRWVFGYKVLEGVNGKLKWQTYIADSESSGYIKI